MRALIQFWPLLGFLGFFITILISKYHYDREMWCRDAARSRDLKRKGKSWFVASLIMLASALMSLVILALQY